MPKPHFAIEPPRKIRICIEGYDAHARTQAQKRKQQERRQRLARRAAVATAAVPAASSSAVAPEACSSPSRVVTPMTQPDVLTAASELGQQLQDALS